MKSPILISLHHNPCRLHFKDYLRAFCHDLPHACNEILNSSIDSSLVFLKYYLTCYLGYRNGNTYKISTLLATGSKVHIFPSRNLVLFSLLILIPCLHFESLILVHLLHKPTFSTCCLFDCIIQLLLRKPRLEFEDMDMTPGKTMQIRFH